MKDKEQMVLFLTSILQRVYMQPLWAILMNYGMMMTSKCETCEQEVIILLLLFSSINP